MADANQELSSSLFLSALQAAEAANRVSTGDGQKVASDRLVQMIREGRVAHDVFREVASVYSDTVLMQCLTGGVPGQAWAQEASWAAEQLLDALQSWYRSRPGWRRIAFRTARQFPMLADRLSGCSRA